MAQKIRIISKREGFRRCGIAHSETATFYDPAQFDEDQVKRLTDDPMLIVDLVEVIEEDGDGKVEVVASSAAQVKAAKSKTAKTATP